MQLHLRCRTVRKLPWSRIRDSGRSASVQDLAAGGRCSLAHHRQHRFALRFFLTQTANRLDLARKLVRLADPRQLPVVLTRYEVGRRLNASGRFRRVTPKSSQPPCPVPQIGYLAGLRPSEQRLMARRRQSVPSYSSP